MMTELSSDEILALWVCLMKKLEPKQYKNIIKFHKLKFGKHAEDALLRKALEKFDKIVTEEEPKGRTNYIG